MFDNIGAKIKGLAKFLFYITCVVFLIASVVVIMAGLSSNSDDSVLTIFAGILIMIVGIIVAWLNNVLLYGFGELIDSNQKILKLMEEKK